MTVARNKYVIYRRGEPAIIAYADQVTMSPTGDLVFHQVRKSALVNDKGVRSIEDDMAIVLVVSSGEFQYFELLAGNSPAYKESGQIEIQH
jgi:hypothetical protein